MLRTLFTKRNQPQAQRYEHSLHAIGLAQLSDFQAEAIDLDAAYAQTSIQQQLDDLDHELIGLTAVKTRIRQIAALLLVARLRAAHRLDSDRPTLHMSFTGRPGTGKTSVAMRIAKILHHLGYLCKGHLVVATRDDLVGQYVGHTAPKTKEMLKTRSTASSCAKPIG